MYIVDAIILMFILMSGAIGFSRGAIKQTTMFVGFILVLILSFILKNPVSTFFYEKLPFFSFSGVFKGVEVLNILLYELLAFFLVLAVLIIVLKVFTFISGVLEKILKFTIILAIPSKILGLVIGLVQGYIIAFLILYFISLPVFNFEFLDDSELTPSILGKTPILSNVLEDSVLAMEEIYELKDKYKETNDPNEFNKEALDILLTYEIITIESTEKLISKGKLNITSIDTILDKHR